MKKVFLLTIFLLLGVLLAWQSRLVKTEERKTVSRDKLRDFENVSLWVAKVLDGDTIILENGETVRYLGIDTPESVEEFAQEAKELNENLVLGKEIKLELETNESNLYDKYNRLLAYVWSGKILVNEKLVEEGLARVSVFKGQSLKYIKQLYAAQNKAKEDKRGVWAGKD